jgi:hypothetical protein
MALSDLPTSERMKRRVVSTGDLEKLERDEADRYTSVLLKHNNFKIPSYLQRYKIVHTVKTVREK